MAYKLQVGGSNPPAPTETPAELQVLQPREAAVPDEDAVWGRWRISWLV